MYRVKYSKAAKKFIDKLQPKERSRVVAAIDKLPDTGDIKQLKGNAGVYRLRVGDYRIIYTVDHGELLIFVVDAGNRGQIYNGY